MKTMRISRSFFVVFFFCSVIFDSPSYSQSLIDPLLKHLGGNFFHNDVLNRRDYPDQAYPPITEPGRIQLTLSDNIAYEDIYRFRSRQDNVDQRISYLYNNTALSLDYRLWNAPGSSTIDFTHLRTSVEWDCENTSFDLSHAAEKCHLSFDQTFLYNHLKLYGLGGMTNTDGKQLFDHIIDLQLLPARWLAVGMNFRQDRQSFLNKFSYKDNLINLPFLLHTRQNEYRFNLNSRYLSIHSKYALVNLKNIDTTNYQAKYLFEPDVDLINWYVEAFISPISYLKIEIGYRNIAAEGNAYAYYQSQRFSKITQIRYHDEQFALGLKYQRNRHHYISFAYTRTVPAFYSRGHVDSWPFTSTLIDLLGMRQYFIGDIKINVDKYSILYNVDINNKSKIKITCDYFSAYPQGYFLTWRPLFLVFGITDEKTKNIVIENIIFTSFQCSYVLYTSKVDF